MLKENRKKWKAWVAAGLGVCVIASGTSAYLKNTVGEVQNVITVGDIKAVLEEPHWNPEKKTYLHPGESTEKDPIVKNTGLNDEYAFLEICIPKRTIAIIDDSTKIKTDKESRELFTFEAEKGWELVEQREQTDQKIYVYGYSEILKPGEQTEPLFRNICAVNYLEGDLKGDEVFSIQVKAKVIQANVEGENLSVIYRELLKQEQADQKGESYV
nr:hypothetical protein [uncultured Blautia sp.]